MKGFYFVNSDINNKRAHTFQILNTVEFINPFLSLELVFPEYKKDYNLKELFSYYGLAGKVPVSFKSIFGIKESCVLAFLLFNISTSYFLFKKKIKKEADFIYFRSSFFFPLACFALAINTPFFYEPHRKPLSWSERIRDSFLAKFAAGLVVISDGLYQYYLKQNKNVLIAHDAVSLQRFDFELDKNEARQKLNLSQNAILGVYSGAVRKIKGIEIVFSAARSLPSVNFEIVGPIGPEFEKHPVSDNIHLIGKKSQEIIPTYLKAADFLIIPHPDNEYSQSPMKLFEYLAAGRPIISVALDNIKEVLPTEGNLLFEPSNSDSLVTVIKKYIEKKELYDREAQNNILVAREYTWEKRGEKIARFIKQSKIKQQ